MDILSNYFLHHYLICPLRTLHYGIGYRGIFADRILLELDAAEVPPFPALVKVRVVMAISLVRFFLRKPRSAAVFLYDRHISGAGVLR